MHATGGKAGRPDAAFLGAGTSLLEITGVNRLPPHFFFIIKIKEIQSQDKNIIELWTEKIQEFTMTGEGTRAILPWCPRAASARWQAFHLHSLPWTAFGSEWS